MCFITAMTCNATWHHAAMLAEPQHDAGLHRALAAGVAWRIHQSGTACLIDVL